MKKITIHRIKSILLETLFLSLLMTLSLHIHAQQRVIGTGTVTGRAIPIEPYYGYTYSQVIYPASDVGAGGTFAGITFFATSATTLNNSDSWVVYLGHTTKTSFSSTTDWEPFSSLTEVFSGTATISSGVVTIVFDTPFSYNGTDNLIVAVDENKSGYDGSSHDFYTTSTGSDYRALTYRNDNTNPDPASPPTAYARYANASNIHLITCLAPDTLMADAITTTSASLTWSEMGTATQWEVEMDTLGFSQGTGVITAVTSTQLSVSNLASGTDYSFYARSACGSGDSSTWTGPYSFKTQYTCPQPDSLLATSITTSSAVANWFETGSAASWDVEYGFSGFVQGTGTIMNSSTDSLMISNLLGAYSYDYYVMSKCSSTDSSFWTGPYTFTTDCNPLSGTYTVDTTVVISATNFHTMEDFVFQLNNCGVNGAVVLNVSSDVGVEQEPWDINTIAGASMTNTVTINGNGLTLNKKSSSNHFVRLSGASYLTIDNVNFMNQTTSAVFGIQMKDSCHHIMITNNTFDLGQSTSTASGGIIASNSTTSATSGGSNAGFVSITNNEIIGGYYGISLYGGTPKLTGCTVSNNEIHDFYQYGILFRNSDSNIVENNDIYRNNRTSYTSFYGIRIGVSTRTIVRGNKVHDSGVGSYTCYPIEMQGAPNTGTQESLVYNNQIYNMQSTSTTYAMLFSNTTVRYIKVYHNSVILDAGGSGTKRGIYFNTNSDSNTVQNNMIVISGDGTGTKIGYYLKSGSSPLVSDNNVVHVSGSGTLRFGYDGSNRTTLSDWQTATSLDANSYESDPFFASPSTGNLTPLDLATDNIGAVIAGITTDALGATRSTTTPDAGAIEFTGIPGDMELTSISLESVDLCYGSADSAFATVTNVLGSAVDFSVNPLTVVWSVAGPVNTMDSIILNSGILTADTVVSISSIDMSLPGDYIVSAYIKANAVNASTANDTIYDGFSETIKTLLAASPDSTTITSPWDSANLTTESSLYPSPAFFITERCQYAGSSTGEPSPTPTWMDSDDYIEITGPPGASLEGITYEMWYSSSLLRISYTFVSGEVLGPNGTAILGTYQGTSSPSDYFYVVSSGYTTGSSNASGHLLKDASGTIIDAMVYATYSFPTSSGVTTADWSGTNVSGSSSWGIRLEGADLNDNTGWSKATQDPNTVNASVTVPAVPTTPGTIAWDSAGSTVGTEATFFGGPYNMDGIHTYVVTYANTCGTFMDTVVVTADLTKATMTDSTHVTCNGAANGTATVTASGGDAPYTYLWDNGDVTAMADSLSPGTYTVTVYDANNWPAVAMVTITEPVVLMASSSSTPSTCGVPSGSATVVATGGTTPYAYMWSDGQTSAVAANLTGGGYTVTITDSNMCSYIASATVSDIGAPTILIVVDSVVACYGGSNGVVTASATGGSTPYAYAWSSGGVTATENGLTIGTYDVTLTDASGCVATESVTMTENTPLLAIVTGTTNPLCNGDASGTASSIAGGGVSPYSYAWSNGDVLADADSLMAGGYSLTVTDAVGCMQSTSVSITQPNPLVGAFVNAMDVSCNAGSDGAVEILTSGGTAPYAMSWSDGSTGTTVSGLSSGYVSVTITDANNCMMMDSVNITEPTALISSASLVSDVLCNGGNTGAAAVTSSGGTMPYVFAWSNGAGGSSANNLAAGTYSVTISDGNNCQSTSSVTVTEPTVLSVSVTSTNVSCFGMNDGTTTAMASGGTSPYSYAWNTGSTASGLSALGMGNYTVSLMDANGCMTSGMTTVTEPVQVTVNLGGDVTLCDGESVSLSAGTGLTSYAWSTGETTETVNVSSASLGSGVTTVSVMVADGSGCMGADSIEVTVGVPVSTAILGTEKLCNYEIGDLDAGPGFSTYTWSNSSSSQLIKVYPSDLTVGSNTFMVTVTDNLGCEGVASFDVELHPEVIFNLPADTMVWKDSVFTIMADSGYASYLWNTQEITQSINLVTGGTYSCIVTDSVTGCAGADEIVVAFVLGVNDVEISELKLYPNPASDFINLAFQNFGNAGQIEIELLSITGQLVRTINVDVSATNGTQTIDVSKLAVGTYFVTFKYENERVVKQFTIK